jgi:hypothetical protein
MKNNLRVLGIYREEVFSNRAINADKDILDKLINHITEKNNYVSEVVLLRGEDFYYEKHKSNYDLIFSMAQNENVLRDVEKLELAGAKIFNSSKSIRNCYRSNLSSLLSDKKFSYPQFIKVNTSGEIPKIFYSEDGYWVKRGDFHSLIDEDVQYIDAGNELKKVLALFRDRGVTDVIVQKNHMGELYKFYGVKNAFFKLRFMGKTGTSRYQINPGNPLLIFDEIRLEKLAHKAAEILGLDFFGGDCIITQEGKMHFIDFNDWPSFRSCVGEVVPEMTEYAFNKLNSEIFYENCINQ